MSFLQVSTIYPAIIIEKMAGAIIVAGLYIVARAASLRRLSPATEVMGGIVLMLIGLSFLHEHGVFFLFLATPEGNYRNVSGRGSIWTQNASIIRRILK